MPYRGRPGVGIGFLLALSSCRGAEMAAPPAEPPKAAGAKVVSASVAANPQSVLSAIVTFTAEHSDSARVVFLDDVGMADSTPYVGVTGGAQNIVPLGLRPNTTYRKVVQVKAAGGTGISDTLSFATAGLPELLQRVNISVAGSSDSGLTLTALQVGGQDVFALGFDATGEIRWYRRFQGTEEAGGELKQQSNGHLTLYRGTSHGSQRVPGHYVEFTSAGDSIRAIAVPPPRYLDNHELWITTAPDGQERFHFFTYDFRRADLSSRGGAADALLAGHQLVRQRPDGSTEFEWNAWDHLGLEEWIEPAPRQIPSEFDFDHPNSIALDRDGNYIVSFRRLHQVIKIDAVTGAVLWRLGGLRNEFSFVNDPLNGFSGQHSVALLANGNLLLFDNGSAHLPPESRAVEYALDPIAKTATLVWEFRHQPPIYTRGAGLAQRLENGNTVVAYAQIGHLTEVGPDGTVRWEADVVVDGKPAFTYRLLRIRSLYRYEEP